MFSIFRNEQEKDRRVRGHVSGGWCPATCIVRLIAILSVCVASQVVVASQIVLSDIKITPRGNDTHVLFDLGIPLHYVKHFPANRGEILQIQMLMENETGREIHKEVRQGEELAPPPGMDALLVYVTYEEGVPGGPYLTLRFSRPVSFNVEAGESLTTLSVLIIDDQAPKVAKKPAVTPESDEQVVGSTIPVPPVPQTSRGVPEISMKTLQEQVFKQAEKSAEKLDAKTGQAEEPAEQVASEGKTKDQAGQELSSIQFSPTVKRAPGQPVTTPAPGKQKLAAAEPKADSEAGELMAKARQALTFGDNDGAIQLLRRVVALPESEHTQDARELIGLALERSNQIPRAKFEYKKYLKLYKEGDGTSRVRQRLQALQSIATEKRKKLRKTVRRDQDVFTVFGRWSQAFTTRFQQRTPENDDDNVGSEDTVLTRRVDSHLSLRSRMRTADRNIQAVVTANQVFDMIDGTESESQVSSIYLDYDAFKHGYYTIIGRQRVRNSGVFGRFDGFIAGYDFLPFMRGNFYWGKPVTLNDDRGIDREFWGLKIDVGNRNDPINMNLYSVNQTADGIADRQAFGAGVRYTDKEMTFFSLLDYDFLFDEINLFNFRWGWKFMENSKMNISYNRRQLLFVTSALNNQPLDTSLDDVVNILSEAGARQLAVDRTSLSETFTIGNSYQFDRDNQLNVDLTMFKSSGTVSRFDLENPLGCVVPNCTMVNVPGAPSTGSQYTLSAQWISGNLFAQRDLYVFGARFSSFDSYNDITLFANARMPDINNWKPRPRITISNRSFNSGGFTSGTRVSIAPSIKVDYAWKKYWVFDMEFGFEIVEYSDEDVDDEVRQNVRIGYNYNF
ncbi:hypothetical protein [Kaarinaea lacus]